MLAAITSRHPSALREGATLGLVVATATWIWVAAVDAAAGDPFHTFEVLGGVLAFTVAHYLLNVLASTELHASQR